jgi:hypothetical protein
VRWSRVLHVGIVATIEKSLESYCKIESKRSHLTYFISIFVNFGGNKRILIQFSHL